MLCEGDISKREVILNMEWHIVKRWIDLKLKAHQESEAEARRGRKWQ